MKVRAKTDTRVAGDTAAPSYDVVALVASAGGRPALEAVLRALPEGFAIPLIVMQHLGHEAPEPLRPFGASLPFTVEWARHGSVLAPGSVLAAPPRAFLEVLPDATCVVSACSRGALDKPMDRLLGSLARSFAHRAVAVVLSGMMDDGAAGAREIRAEGGCVIVQSDAEYAEMPNAAIRAGGADLTLPAEKIALFLAELAAGVASLKPPSERQVVADLFAGPGEARAAMRAVDWGATPLGPVLEWSTALSTTVRNVMSSTFPSCIYWGADFVQIYNEAFAPILGTKRSPAGRPARLTWAELWSRIGPEFDSIVKTGAPISAENRMFHPERDGYPEEAYLTYCCSPLHDADGSVRGVLTTARDTTEHVRARRRLELLGHLAAVKGGESALLVAESAAKVLAESPLDVPFAVIYLFDKSRARGSLAAAVGVNAGSLAAPHTLWLTEPNPVWPLGVVARSEAPCILSDLASRLPGVHAGPWPEPPSSATLLPLRVGADGSIAGVIVLGSSPRLRLDTSYEDFLGVIARHISSAIGEAEGRRRERERSERLAELDRAKVEFFSNVSHEFRTPLTLLLGPLEDMLARRPALPPDLEEPIEAAARNGRRLLTLVNTLLDFSQAESHRQQAQLEPTDLSALTLDIASVFRSAIEAAGLSFSVRCDAGIPQVWVDRQMWEKIIANLLSNALKFTFHGSISVSLEALKLHAQLVIADTGIGIPEHEVPNLFKRFHRVRGARARTAEGSGIGLWMVDDLVKRIGGQLTLRSQEGAGTSFRIWIPYKTSRARSERPESGALRPTGFASQAALQASRWVLDATTDLAPRGGVLEDVLGPPPPAAALGVEAQRAHLLVVDDNADMRDYLERLLSGRWRVALSADGASAFSLALELRPELILADVTMPGLNGFELLERVRAHAELRHTPVVLLTARAGEETAIEGLMAGADDYIAKPFSPRELVVRIAAAVERARAEKALRKSEEKYRTLFHSIDEGLCIIEVLFDASGEAFDYRFLEMNPTFVEQTGLVGALGKTVRELAPQHEAFWFETCGEIARTGRARRFEHRARAANRWYDIYAFRVGAPEERKIALLVNDVFERRLAEETLREREARKALLLELADALRPLSDPAEIQRAAMRVLGEQLKVDRVLYADIEQDGELAVVRDNFTQPGIVPWTGTFSVQSFGEPAARVQRGETVVIPDVTALPGLDAEAKAAFAASAALANVSVPLLEGGRFAAILVVHHGAPRQWKQEEVALVQEVAQRVWAAVERGRAEAELLARNAELERFNGLSLERERRMNELGEQIDALRRRLGERPPPQAAASREADASEGA